MKKTKNEVPVTRHAGTTGDHRKFEVCCYAGQSGSLQVSTESLSVEVGQRVLRQGAEEIWHSVAVFAKEGTDGSLVIRVFVFNPDWDEPLQIANITSRPNDPNCRTALGCNLDHVTA